MTVGALDRRDAPLLLRLALAGTAAASVLPLLAWVFRAMPFRTAALVLWLPCWAAIGVGALVTRRTATGATLRSLVAVGVLGGLVGTAAYDLFRVPFVALGGLGLLEPIESYGVLLLGASSSSPLTGFAGWTYHIINGIGFGVAYAVVAAGRDWRWGVAWGAVLETTTVVTPFAAAYGLVTDDGVRWLPITLAYLAHLPYGYAVGRFAQRPDDTLSAAREVTRRPAIVAVAVTIVGLALWHRPWSVPDSTVAGRDVAAGASAVIEDGRFEPKWLRIAPGDCVTLRNLDDLPHTFADGQSVAPGGTIERCRDDRGVHRVRLDDDEPFSGGFVIVDPT